MRPASVGAAVLLLALAATGCSRTADAVREARSSEPPPGLEYVPPAPGTYELPPIQLAVDGRVLDADGTKRRLFDYLGDRYVLLSMIYLNCNDARGCPLAAASFHMIQQDLERDEALSGRVRLVSLSFDPDRDTPAAMRAHGAPDYLETPPEERTWSLLTTASQDDLRPILDGFGQTVIREVDEEGRETGGLAHVLKVFLVDRERRVRNIYSSSYLHPAIAINDLKTLLAEEG
jgi:cytochrome oxidase Cu insertion factor (SCO1/SenC/PrrC family)